MMQALLPVVGLAFWREKTLLIRNIYDVKWLTVFTDGRNVGDAIVGGRK